MPYVPNTEIEVINEVPRGGMKHALFDFDGTISVLRQGWQQIMIPLMVSWLMPTPKAEQVEELEWLSGQFVARTTGIQTIYQMIGLRDMVVERGGEPKEPAEYKQIYTDTLWARVRDRVAALKTGEKTPDEMSVPGSIAFLRSLRRRDITCYLASGTDRPYVVDEATALGVADLFDGGIHGALEDYETYSKAMVIAEILQANDLSGSELVVFGDGYVEIENAKEAGGIAVGVASDEVDREEIDQWKRSRLIGAGADLIVPDFRQGPQLLAYLMAEEPYG
jgi:phosphoglycolate phosphatase